MKSIQFVMINKTSRIAAIIVLVLFFLITAMSSVKAQRVVQHGNTFVQQVDSVKETKTEYVYQDSKGKKYPIYLSSKGNAYIYAVSKNGKTYRRYLPKVTEQLKTKKQ